VTRIRIALLVLAAAQLGLLLTLRAPSDPEHPGVLGGLRTAAAQLRGDGPRIDLVQDYVASRRLVGSGDLYPTVSEEFADVGIRSAVVHRSTHPPTAFVLTLAVAGFSWRAAAAIWAALMLVAIAYAWWALGASPPLATALAPLTLVWPPAAWSMGQLTPVWLLGLALAWRWRDRPAGAGGVVALASLTKLLPVLSLAPLVLTRPRRVLLGFGAVWAAALAVLLGLRADALGRYVHVIRSTGSDQAARGENSALLFAARHHFGYGGLAVAAVLVLGVALTSLGAGSEWSWWAWCWLGVALLPIAWIYSLLPLLPAMAFCVRRGRLTSRALVATALVLPFLVQPFGLPGATRLAWATACVGLALLAIAYAPLVDRVSVRIST
jgi:Glycosyltransferase family 87